MKELTEKELNDLYKQWISEKRKPQVYCSQYPEFLKDMFPDGIIIKNGSVGQLVESLVLETR